MNTNNNSQARLIDEALTGLTEKQRQYVRLICISKSTLDQAAKLVGFSDNPARVYRRLTRIAAVSEAMTKVNKLVQESAKQESTKKEGRFVEHDTTKWESEKQEAISEVSKTDHVPASAKGSDALRDALREIMGDTLDEARVTAIARSIVKQEVGLAPVRIQVCEPCGKVADMGTQHRQFNKLVTKLAAGCNVYLAGPAGTGKTTGARSAATALSKMWGRDVRFYFNGAIDSEHKLLGFVDAQGRIVSRPFREAFTNGGVYLFDEVDASLAGALLAFNAALANSHCDFPDGCFEKHPDFRCVAAANTWGFGATHDYVGRNKLDEAFRDRFVMLNWDTDEALERHIALTNIEDENLGSKWITYVQQCRAKAKTSGIRCVISPRASIYGCALLQAGEAWDEVSESCVRKGMPEESWKQINA